MGMELFFEKKEKKLGSGSGSWRTKAEKSMDALCSLGGVPVFILPTVNPCFTRHAASPMDANSPALPALKLLDPIWTTPFRNVPVARTTASDKNEKPVWSVTPFTFLFSMIRSSTIACFKSIPSVFSIRDFMAWWYFNLSFWVRVDWTAGPLLVFKVWY